MIAEPLVVNGEEILPGTRKSIRIPVARRYTAGDVSLPISIVHGRKSGPRLFVSAAIHGDEINGVEIILRLLKKPQLNELSGGADRQHQRPRRTDSVPSPIFGGTSVGARLGSSASPATQRA